MPASGAGLRAEQGGSDQFRDYRYTQPCERAAPLWAAFAGERWLRPSLPLFEECVFYRPVALRPDPEPSKWMPRRVAWAWTTETAQQRQSHGGLAGAIAGIVGIAGACGIVELEAAA
jgi:hypothetical protein